MDQLLVTNKMVKKNKNLKGNRKRTLHENRHVKGGSLRTKIGKLVAMANEEAFLDLTNITEEKEKHRIVTVPADLDRLLACMEEKKICGLSGSGFPTIDKIQTLLESKAPSRFLIVNAVACDPGLLQDNWLLHNKLEQIEKGIGLLSSYITFDRVVLATKAELHKSNAHAPYEIVRVPDRYPMGEERQLIRQVLDRQIPQDKVPARLGVLVLNLQTIYAIYQAAFHDQTLNTRYLTVADLEDGDAVVVHVENQSKISDIVEKVMVDYLQKGTNVLRNATIYYGGGMFHACVAEQDARINMKTNFIGIGRAAEFQDQAKCKGCGACKKHCPMEINVAKAVKAIQNGQDRKAAAYGAMKCIQCGACSYYCSAGKNTMGMIGAWKDNQKEKMR